MKIYELNRPFQASWVAKLPWAKSIVGAKGKATQIKCKVCNIIDGRNRLLLAKSNSLWKPIGCRKATIISIGVVMGDIYFLKTNQHMINEKLYVQKGKNYVLWQVVEGVVVEQKKNYYNLHSFSIYFHRAGQ
jgi:hypothetical protein